MQHVYSDRLAEPPALPGRRRRTESHLTTDSDTVIFTEGERGLCAFIIERGRVEISVERSGQKIILGHRGPGEVFGEMAIIDDEPRSATVRAVEPCDLLKITREQLVTRLEQTDPVLRMCLTVILERFRTTLRHLQVIGHEAPGLPLLADRTEREALDETIHDSAIREIKLEQELREAIDQEQFELHYQPIVDLAGGHLAGYEALIRWRHPEQGLISPGVFMPTTEASGLIVPLGRWIRRHACLALERIAPAAPGRPGKPAFISLNLSGRDLYDPDFLEQIDDLLSETGLDPRRVKLELTETLLMQQPDEAAATLQACRSRGLTIAVDDFGTGYSSLSYLHQFPIDALKIDRSFVAGMHRSDQHHQIVRSIAHLARELGIELVAEGIERAEQAAMLRDLGCHFGQGFLYAPGLPEAEARDFALSYGTLGYAAAGC